MPTPYLAPSLVRFRQSINEMYPNRDKESDGWLGDAAHQSRQSEHNPDAKGCVHAIDVDIDDNDANHNLREEILYSAIGNPAVWYVISNGKIYSRTHDWQENTYLGSNPHTKHVHISINLSSFSENYQGLVLKRVPLPGRDDMTPQESSRLNNIYGQMIDGDGTVGIPTRLGRVEELVKLIAKKLDVQIPDYDD